MKPYQQRVVVRQLAQSQGGQAVTYQYYYTMQCEKCFRSCRLSKSGKTWICTICKHREKAKEAKP